MTKYTKNELAIELEKTKQQLREREREREQNYELVPFGGEYSFEQC